MKQAIVCYYIRLLHPISTGNPAIGPTMDLPLRQTECPQARHVERNTRCRRFHAKPSCGTKQICMVSDVVAAVHNSSSLRVASSTRNQASLTKRMCPHGATVMKPGSCLSCRVVSAACNLYPKSMQQLIRSSWKIKLFGYANPSQIIQNGSLGASGGPLGISWFREWL